MKASRFAWLCFAALFLSSLPSSAVEYRWQSLYPYPTGEDFVDIDGSSDHDIWAITSAGSIWHYDGVEWKEHTWLPRRELVALEVVSSGEAYIAGNVTGTKRGVILQLGGGRWREWERSFSGYSKDLAVLGKETLAVTFDNETDGLLLATPDNIEEIPSPLTSGKLKLKYRPSDGLYGLSGEGL